MAILKQILTDGLIVDDGTMEPAPEIQAMLDMKPVIGPDLLKLAAESFLGREKGGMFSVKIPSEVRLWLSKACHCPRPPVQNQVHNIAKP